MCQALTRKIPNNYAHTLFTYKITICRATPIRATTSCGLSSFKSQVAVTNALSCSSATAAVRPNPLTTAPVPFRKKARSSRAAFRMPNDRRAFRLRFGDGRSPNRRPKLVVLRVFSEQKPLFRRGVQYASTSTAAFCADFTSRLKHSPSFRFDIISIF